MSVCSCSSTGYAMSSRSILQFYSGFVLCPMICRDGLAFGSYLAWRLAASMVSSFLAFTSRARPITRSAQMPYQLGSNSYQARPCREDWGWAWWLLCHPSPKVSNATQKLFREVSAVWYRRGPHMWVAEFTSQVE